MITVEKIVNGQIPRIIDYTYEELLDLLEKTGRESHEFCGKQGSAFGCPMHFILQDNGFPVRAVTGKYISVDVKGLSYDDREIPLGNEVRRFITEVDSIPGEDFEEFTPGADVKYGHYQVWRVRGLLKWLIVNRDEK